ncbi:MAG: DNA gyrase subunit A [Candidatus Dojkabacteria bacterium]
MADEGKLKDNNEDLALDSTVPALHEAEGSVQGGIVTELKQSYINYAMSVIVARALPEVRDGLKPVQRRILYAMYKMGIMPGSAYKKVARISGETMGKYHPHGDASINDALVRMAQDFNLRYPLIDGQGNFGSIDGDSAAAARYIEARLAKVGAKMLEGVEHTVNYLPNYDENEIEPVVLPTGLPNLLINGSEGIAVGMATKIPPHNLNEVVNAVLRTIDSGNSWDFENIKKLGIDYEKDIKNIADIDKLSKDRFHKFESQIEIKELLKDIKGPDFPTGATMYNQKNIAQVYETGRGGILMRAVSRIEEMKGGKFRIIISELPYQVNKAVLLARIAQLYKDKKIEGISDLRDESNREGIRIVVELKREAKPKTVENQLYKYTELQKNFSANMLALVDGEPHVLNLRDYIQYFIAHRQEIVIRRNEFELGKAKEREHILEGLMIALDHLDEVIATIRKSKDVEVAKVNLMKTFKLSDIQAQAILDMRLARLAALEREKIELEYKEVLKTIKELLKLLNSPAEILNIIKVELAEIKEKYGDERRTKVFKGDVDELSEEDLIVNEKTFVMISTQGYIKRVKYDTYRTQNRGGSGKKAVATKEDDSVRHVFDCNTHDEIMFLTNKGKVYIMKVHEIPEYGATAKGLPIVNLINISNGELVTSVLTKSASGKILDEDVEQEDEEAKERQGKDYKFLFMATKKGVVKKTLLEEFNNIRSNGLIAITLTEGDELIWVKPTDGKDQVILVSKLAKSIHFHEEDVRETGRSSQGVRGIKLKPEDEVISMDIIRKEEAMMLTIAENGFGKMTELSQFTLQKRGGSGIFAARVNSKTGTLVVARVLDHPNKELLILSVKGQAIKIPTKDLPLRNRQTAGVTLMRVKDGDKVAAVAIV